MTAVVGSSVVVLNAGGCNERTVMVPSQKSDVAPKLESLASADRDLGRAL